MKCFRVDGLKTQVVPSIDCKRSKPLEELRTAAKGGEENGIGIGIGIGIGVGLAGARSSTSREERESLLWMMSERFKFLVRWRLMKRGESMREHHGLETERKRRRDLTGSSERMCVITSTGRRRDDMGRRNFWVRLDDG